MCPDSNKSLSYDLCVNRFLSDHDSLSHNWEIASSMRVLPPMTSNDLRIVLGFFNTEIITSATSDRDIRPRFTSSPADILDRKSTRLNSSHVATSYAVFCLKTETRPTTRH